MTAKAGWICSAGSSGSASSLRSIRCVRALSRYTLSPDLLSNRSSTAWLASITIINVQLLTDAGLLQVHCARVYCQCGCPIYRHIHEEMAPDLFCKFTGKTCPCAQTILYRFSELVCRRVVQFRLKVPLNTK